jgi:Tfp pilus assembly protein PilN
MIEINLLPGSPKRAPKRKAGIGLPAFNKPAGLPKFDRMGLFVVLGWLAGPLAAGWLFWSATQRMEQLSTSIEAAQADSARYAEVRKANDILRARQDTIAQKLQIIQEIDASRYTWSHIMDEVSRALPQYTWLRSVLYTASDGPMTKPSFRIDGRTGNTFALTQFMLNLEASPFLRGVTLVMTSQVVEQEKSLYSFMLDAQFEEPPPEVIQTVPLFGSQEGY